MGHALSRLRSVLTYIVMLLPLRDGPSENLCVGRGGGWWVGEVPKKYSHKGKLNEKNSCNSKKYSCYGLQKIHTRNLITKKIPAARNLPPPPT